MVITSPRKRFLEEVAHPVMLAAAPTPKFKRSSVVGSCVDCGSPGVDEMVLRRGDYPSLCSACYFITSKQNLDGITKTREKRKRKKKGDPSKEIEYVTVTETENVPFAGKKGGGLGVLIEATEGGYLGLYLPPRRYEFEDHVPPHVDVRRNAGQEADTVDFGDFLLQSLDLLLENGGSVSVPFCWGWLQANDMHKAVAALEGVNVDPDLWTLFAPEKLKTGKATLSPYDWHCVRRVLQDRAAGKALRVAKYAHQKSARDKAFKELNRADDQPVAKKDIRAKERNMQKAEADITAMEAEYDYLPTIGDLATVIELVG